MTASMAALATTCWMAAPANDALQAAGGADTMIGGAGNDLYLIDNNFGKIIEAAGGGVDGISSDVSTIDLGNFANVENLSFSATTASVGIGNALNNIIEGNNGTDSLVGKDGNDTLNGGAGKDTMDGGNGDDTYVVDNADDVIVEGVGPGKDTIIGRTTVIDLGLDAFNIENVLLETGGLSVFGNALANKITGNERRQPPHRRAAETTRWPVKASDRSSPATTRWTAPSATT